MGGASGWKRRSWTAVVMYRIRIRNIVISSLSRAKYHITSMCVIPTPVLLETFTADWDLKQIHTHLESACSSSVCVLLWAEVTVRFVMSASGCIFWMSTAQFDASLKMLVSHLRRPHGKYRDPINLEQRAGGGRLPLCLTSVSELAVSSPVTVVHPARRHRVSTAKHFTD